MTALRTNPSLFYGRKGKIEEAHSILTHFEREAVISISSSTKELSSWLDAKFVIQQDALNEKKEKAELLLVSTLRKELEDGLRVSTCTECRF